MWGGVWEKVIECGVECGRRFHMKVGCDRMCGRRFHMKVGCDRMWSGVGWGVGEGEIRFHMKVRCDRRWGGVWEKVKHTCHAAFLYLFH